MKQKFYKNLFQSISFFSIIMLFETILITAFIASLNYENNNGWILLIMSFVLIILFFLIGFYWIFQKVIFDDNGIKIVFLNKIIKECKWTEVLDIEITNIMKNPALKINLTTGSEIHLDKRKSIIIVIEKYLQKKIV
ncbi:MAG: hypothetical protein NC182_05305 [Prevotella sp.]|nr:hypothetical protein [Staphylococcus sp.]MCM1350602.1 hypothetical protein [Prevotella sp.]